MSNSEFAEPYTIIEPFGGGFKGDVTVPGDKSISHRAVLFAAMAEGTSIQNENVARHAERHCIGPE